RDRARDPAVRDNPAALAEVIDTAPVADQPPQLLLALDRQLNPSSPERLPFLRRIQQAHPGDIWANLTLGNVLGVQGQGHQHQPAEAVRYYQAAVAVRPQAALGYYRLGVVLCLTGRVEEGVESCRRAANLEPDSASARFFLAKALSDLGRHDEATH